METVSSGQDAYGAWWSDDEDDLVCDNPPPPASKIVEDQGESQEHTQAPRAAEGGVGASTAEWDMISVDLRLFLSRRWGGWWQNSTLRFGVVKPMLPG